MFCFKRLTGICIKALMVIAGSTAVFSAQAATYSAVADAYTRSSDPTANFGMTTSVRAQQWAQTTGFVKFNLDALSGSPIESAVLRIPLDDVGTPGWVTVHRALGGWTETGITHNNKPGLSNALASFNVGSADVGQTVSVNVTQLVRQMISSGSDSIAFATANADIGMGTHNNGSPIRLDVSTSPTGGTGSATANLFAAADAYTKSTEASSNFGDLQLVRSMLWEDAIGFAKFDLDGIPTGAEVSSAKLHINARHIESGGTISIHRVAATWSENSITHANKPALGPPLATFSISPADAGSTITVDATAVAKSLLGNRSTNFGIALVTSSSSIGITSRETGHPMRFEISTGSTGGTSNTAPTISGNPARSVTVNTNYGFTPSAADADGDSISFAIRNKPSWAAFSTGTGRLSGVPTDSHVGVHGNISITASDGQATDTLGPFEIEVTDDGSGSASLSWTSPTQNTDGTPLVDLARFRIDWTRSNDGAKGSVTINNPSVSSYVVENLAAGTYVFTVVAINDDSVASAPSNKVSDTVN